MNKENLVGIVLFSIVALYAMFHVGRWYERKLVEDAVYEAYEHSTDTDYVTIEGEWATGRCFTPHGDEVLTTYYPSL